LETVAAIRQALRDDLRTDRALAQVDAWAAAPIGDSDIIRSALDALLGLAL
jgi:hypothetical protein